MRSEPWVVWSIGLHQAEKGMDTDTLAAWHLDIRDNIVVALGTQRASEGEREASAKTIHQRAITSILRYLSHTHTLLLWEKVTLLAQRDRDTHKSQSNSHTRVTWALPPAGRRSERERDGEIRHANSYSWAEITSILSPRICLCCPSWYVNKASDKAQQA